MITLWLPAVNRHKGAYLYFLINSNIFQLQKNNWYIKKRNFFKLKGLPFFTDL